jgi:hypothetical protein
LQRHGRQAFAGEHMVQGVDQVGRGIDQRAVEIEYDSAGRAHLPLAIGLAAVAQVQMMGKVGTKRLD